jgi:hypothetical protein
VLTHEMTDEKRGKNEGISSYIERCEALAFLIGGVYRWGANDNRFVGRYRRDLGLLASP